MPDYFGAIFAADPHQSGSFIINEANFYRSRDAVTIKGGSGQLKFGTVLGQLAGDGRYVPSPAEAADGSETATAILFEDTDASGGDVIAGVVAREAEVYAGALTFDPSVVGETAQSLKWAQLLLVGIVVRLEDDPAARQENNLRQTMGY